MIQRSFRQKDKPKMITTDSRGTIFNCGNVVAYNRSGGVIIGIIRDVTINNWVKISLWFPPDSVQTSKRRANSLWRIEFEMLIENIDDEKNFQNQKSK